jgi:hypothetical protein
MHTRTDTATSTLVDRAIPLIRERGIYDAARYLYWCGVPIDVAYRVLTRPSTKRRVGAAGTP